MFLFYGIKLRFSISIKMQFKFCKTNCSLFKCHLFLDLPVRALSLCSRLSFDMLNTLVKTTAPSIINTVKCKMKWPNVQKNYEELFYIFICLRYFTRKITRFFGVDSTNEDLAKTTWVERRRRLAIKKLGGVKVTLKLLSWIKILWMIISGGGISIRVWYGAGSIWRLRGGLQHEVEAGRAAAPQHNLGAGGRQDGAEDHETSSGQGLHHVPHLAVLLMDGIGQYPSFITTISRQTHMYNIHCTRCPKKSGIYCYYYK